MPGDIEVVDVEITLAWSEPPIWRKVRVPTSFTLGDLHDVIQCLLEWEDDHLHAFQFGRSETFDEEDEDFITIDGLITSKKRTFQYIYDFGDSWTHDIRIVGRRYRVENEKEALRLLGGENAAPPEDCGGIDGHYALLDAVNDPAHPEHEWAVSWLGDESFDATAFDRKRAQNCLSHVLS